MMTQNPLQAAICKGFLLHALSGVIRTYHGFVGIFDGISAKQQRDTNNMKRSLTDTATKNAKPAPEGKPKRDTDGGGLYLHVTSAGKYWRYNYRMDGKQKTLALGIVSR